MSTATMTKAIELTREEWLNHRFEGIGASDVPTILGVNRFQSPYTLWATKSRLLPPVDQNIPMRVGHALEDLVSELYVEETDRVLMDPGDYTIWRHPDHEWLFCTPDRITMPRDHETSGAVELKTAGEFRAHEWKDGDPPIENQFQLQIQMDVLGLTWGSLAGLVGNRSFHVYDFPRRDDVLKHIMPKVEEFWERVQNGDAPPVDNTESTAKTLARLHPKDNGETVQLSPEAIAAAEQFEEVKTGIKELKSEKRLLKNVLVEAIGDATFGVGDDVHYSNKHQSRKNHLQVAMGLEGELKEFNIPYEMKSGSEFRVLRKLKVK